MNEPEKNEPKEPKKSFFKKIPTLVSNHPYIIIGIIIILILIIIYLGFKYHTVDKFSNSPKKKKKKNKEDSNEDDLEEELDDLIDDLNHKQNNK